MPGSLNVIHSHVLTESQMNHRNNKTWDHLAFISSLNILQRLAGILTCLSHSIKPVMGFQYKACSNSVLPDRFTCFYLNTFEIIKYPTY